jgi:alpha-tubulin suppressor-like RCC1 family protein
VTVDEWSPILKPTALGIGDVVEIADGWYHACVLDTRGVISCWGDDQWHQLGDGATSARAEPAPIAAP